MKKGRYPDFLGIGAQKAGTTWLSHNLGLHPEIWMPHLKELHYFDEKIHEPASAFPRLRDRVLGRRLVDRRWRRQVRARAGKHLRSLSRKGPKSLSPEDLLWDLRYYAGRPDDGWYASLFEPGRGRTVGEITPSYSMLDEEAVARVHRLMPDAKIVFMMRNPLERAWSQAVMHFGKTGGKAATAVGEKRLRRRFESEGSLLRTDYLRTLGTWGSYYPGERVFVGFLEDVSLFPGELLSGVYAFLGVDPSFRPPGIGRRIHARSSGRAPTDALVYLARRYREDAARLSERFGGYAGFWLYCAERLAGDDPAEESLPYPLWGSPLWEEWKAGTGFREELQSRPLSSF